MIGISFAHDLIRVDRDARPSRAICPRWNIQRNAKFAGDALAFDDFQTPAGGTADFGMRLHALHDVGIGPRRDRCSRHLIGAVQTGYRCFHAADQNHGMKHRAAFRGPDEMPKTRNRHATRAALIHQCVTPERTPTMSAFRPNRPVTCS